ncbi:TPA: hypothetical protein ACYLN4_004029 [Burkholderia lata]
MRDPVNVLYYPDSFPEEMTLKKAVLFFDEIHFMDRPSFVFEGGLGTIAAASPLRQWEQLFRRDGVPLYVQEAPRGPVHGDFLEMITADVNDINFLSRYQDGLRTSKTFQLIQVREGNYGDSETQKQHNAEEVREYYRSVDLPTVLSEFESPMALLTDKNIRPFRFSNTAGLAKTLIFQAATTSAQLNHALTLGVSEGYIPFADASPYGNLVTAKYIRAINTLAPAQNRIPITDLSFAVFESLVDSSVLARIEMKDVVRYRKKSASARDAFLEYLSALQLKASNVGTDQSYDEIIQKLVTTDILPAARVFSNKLQTIFETSLGSLAKGALGGVAAGGGLVQLLGDLSMANILTLGGAAAIYVAKVGIDYVLAERAAQRECALTYVLSLDKV